MRVGESSEGKSLFIVDSDAAKDEIVNILDRRVPGYAKLHPQEREIVEIIIANDRDGNKSRSDIYVAVHAHVERGAGCSLHGGIIAEQLCTIVRKLAI